VLKVTKRAGSPLWQITGVVGDTRVRKSAGTSDKQAAEEIASSLETRLRREQLYGKENETTFGDAALSYIQSKHTDKKPVCSPPALKELIRRHGKRKLASFSSGEIQDIAKALHPTATAATRNRHAIAPFMAVYNHAVARKLAPPMKVERFEEKPAKTQSIDQAWIDAVRSVMPDHHARAMVRLMFETGMRLGTALGLTHGMLHADRCVISAPAELLKNEDPHDFILTAGMVEELSALTRPNYKRRDGKRLFGFVYGSGFRKHLARACKLAGVPYVPPHQSGRHSFATTYIVDHQIDPVTVAELGGWKDVAMLMKRYPHAREAKLRAVVERVSGKAKPTKVVK
jgi:integrase